MKRLLIFLLSLFFSISIAARNSSTQSLLANALIVGMDNANQPFFLCRTSLFGAIQIGTLSAKVQSCIFTHEGKVYSVKEFSIPDKKEFGLYTWSRSEEHAITVGTTVDGKPLFLCQSQLNGTLLVGKTWPGYNHCIVMYKDNELIADITFVLSSLH